MLKKHSLQGKSSNQGSQQRDELVGRARTGNQNPASSLMECARISTTALWQEAALLWRDRGHVSSLKNPPRVSLPLGLERGSVLGKPQLYKNQRRSNPNHRAVPQKVQAPSLQPEPMNQPTGGNLNLAQLELGRVPTFVF